MNLAITNEIPQVNSMFYKVAFFQKYCKSWKSKLCTKMFEKFCFGIIISKKWITIVASNFEAKLFEHLGKQFVQVVVFDVFGFRC